MTRRRHITPSILARWLDVHEVTVLRWIRAKELPALNVGGLGNGAPRYRIFRRDLVVFLSARGLTAEHIQDLFGEDRTAKLGQATLSRTS